MRTGYRLGPAPRRGGRSSSGRGRCGVGRRPVAVSSARGGRLGPGPFRSHRSLDNNRAWPTAHSAERPGSRARMFAGDRSHRSGRRVLRSRGGHASARPWRPARPVAVSSARGGRLGPGPFRSHRSLDNNRAWPTAHSAERPGSRARMFARDRSHRSGTATRTSRRPFNAASCQVLHPGRYATLRAAHPAICTPRERSAVEVPPIRARCLCREPMALFDVAQLAQRFRGDTSGHVRVP